MDRANKENTELIRSTLILPDGSRTVKETEVLKEHGLTLIVNEQRVARLICTRGNLRELVTGRLFTEGFIERADEIKKIWFCPHETEARVFLDHDAEFGKLLRDDGSCCIGNRAFLENIGRKPPEKLTPAVWEPQWIRSMASHFKEGMSLHKKTQGTHSCLLGRGADIVFECEDIGRHNAVDKAVGYALINGIPVSECILYTSGRVPVDMVSKVISAGIGVLASKSVPTAEAVDLAAEYGLTLICRAHEDSIQVMNEPSQRF